jgi:hypothetical protein
MAKTLTQLAAKPQLIKITLNDAAIIEKYEDELEFYIYDRQPIEKFIKIATTMNTDYTSAVGMMNDLILNEDGSQVCKDGLVLPSDVMSLAIQKVIEQLGK